MTGTIDQAGNAVLILRTGRSRRSNRRVFDALWTRGSGTPRRRGTRRVMAWPPSGASVDASAARPSADTRDRGARPRASRTITDRPRRAGASSFSPRRPGVCRAGFWRRVLPMAARRVLRNRQRQTPERRGFVALPARIVMLRRADNVPDERQIPRLIVRRGSHADFTSPWKRMACRPAGEVEGIAYPPAV